jgi:Zn-dependent protease with chaperone function
MSRLRLDRLARTLAGIALGLLALLAVLPALVPTLDVVPPLSTAPAQFGELCRAALMATLPTLDPVRAHLALIPVGLAFVGLAIALADRVRQQRRLHRFLGAQRSRPLRPGDPLHAVAALEGVQDRVRVVVAPAAAPAFTAGFLRPQVFVSEELLRTLTPAELDAAFQHELEHLRRRDPLRLASLRFLERALFWLPLARALADAAAEAIEFRADDAARRIGQLDLAAAIVKAARLGHTPAPAFAPSLGGISVSRRARRLLGEPLPRRPVPALRVAATALVLSLVWAAALFAATPQSRAGGPPCNACVVRSHVEHWLGAS